MSIKHTRPRGPGSAAPLTSFPFSSPLRADGAVTIPVRGGTAVLRPLDRGAVAPLEAVFDQLSAASRYDRYLSGVHHLTGAMRSILTAVDGHDHVAWLGEVDGRPAAIGRWIRVAPCTAEVAFEVVDAHQGRGLGKALLDTLTTVASVSGIQRVEATLLPSNRRSRQLLSGIEMTFRARDGVLMGSGPLKLLDVAVVDRPAVVRLAMDARSAAAARDESATMSA